MQILILGMHRAGTSAITRLINLMGAYLGPEAQMLPATADNPKGYWERIDVLQLHEQLLEAMEADWFVTSEVDLAEVPPHLLAAFHQRARIILHDMNEHRPWVMKDPRFCLLLPLWRPLLETPICIHAARHPLATAHSLEKRDRFPLHFGAALWEQYNARALLASAGLPRFAVCYETLMEQPLETTADLYQRLRDLGVSGLRMLTAEEITTFLSSELQHHRIREAHDAPWLTPTQITLWEALKNSRLDSVDEKILKDPVRNVFLRGYEPLLKPQYDNDWLNTQLDTTRQQLAATESKLLEKEALLKKNVSALKSLQRLFETLHHDVQLALTSWTWRAGFAIAESGRKLGLLQRTPMVQEHIAQVIRNYQAWRRRQTRTLAPDGALTDDDFDEAAYLAQYPDVRDAIARGEFASGHEHFTLQGHQEIASGVRPYLPSRLAPYDALADVPQPEQCAKAIARWSRQPLVSIIMPVYNVESRWLEAAIRSVMGQLYPNWELCIADDGSNRPETLAVLRQLQDSRCKVRFLDNNLGIAGASNAALALAGGDYVTFLDHDDELSPDALYQVVKAINEQDPDLIYSDEDKLSTEGYYLEPHFKPDYSPDLILSINYICHLCVYRKSLLEKSGAFRTGFEGAQDHDLLLRALDHTDRIYHIPRILYHWRMIPGSTAAQFDSKHYAWEAGRRAVEDTLNRRSIKAAVGLGQYPGSYRVKRAIHDQPLISILIPFRDHPDLLSQCLDSILEKTTYSNFELLGISNNSMEPETFTAMARYTARDRRIRFLRHDIPFNYAAINNFAASQAQGAHFLLLNNDITIITPDWLEALLEHSQRAEIGAVGAKLYYPDGTVQHGGVIVGIGGIAGHSHKHAPYDDPGYFSRPHLIQNLSAVTAACLMVKKSLYAQIGGMDEQNLAVAFNDVDFCLRLREKGYLNIFTPYCELYHHESKTRGYEDTPKKKQRFAKEIAYMRKRHAAILRDGDPYYNINLPLDREDFGML